jgi:hypothetical protein
MDAEIVADRAEAGEGVLVYGPWLHEGGGGGKGRPCGPHYMNKIAHATLGC